MKYPIIDIQIGPVVLYLEGILALLFGVVLVVIFALGIMSFLGIA